MFGVWRAIVLGCASAGLATAATAHTAKPEGTTEPPHRAKNQTPDEPDIVLTGKKPPTRKEVFEQAQSLSRASRKYNVALARFAAPLCPGIAGLREDARA